MDNSADLSNSEQKLALDGTEATAEQEQLRKLYVVRKDAQKEKRGANLGAVIFGRSCLLQGNGYDITFPARKKRKEN